MSRRLLFLGGAQYQVPAIKRAVERGFYVVVCGYNPDAPGNRFGHEYHNVSIADLDEVEKLAIEVRADFVLGYVSETAVNTAARVSERVSLPAVSVEVLERLVRKDLFREFQRTRGFDHPEFSVITENDSYAEVAEKLSYPLIVKPADSCGSRGVSKAEGPDRLRAAVSEALSHSSGKKILLEKVVGAGNRQVTGDGFMEDGKLVYLCLGDHIYDAERPTVAIGSSWPTRHGKEMVKKIRHVLGEQLCGAGYSNGPVNADIRIGEDGKIYVIEAAPRFGANYIAQIIQLCTGIDLLDALFDKIEGKMSSYTESKHCFALSLVLHSEKCGTFYRVSTDSRFKRNIYKKDLFITEDDEVVPFSHLGNAVGVLILHFSTRKELEDATKNIRNITHVELK